MGLLLVIAIILALSGHVVAAICLIAFLLWTAD